MNNNNTIHLSNLPRDLYYEDYVAAQLNAGGYCLERSIHKTLDSVGDIFELDIVAKKFSTAKVGKALLEIKSGDWGMSDLYKVKGWMSVLDIPYGGFVVQKIRAGKTFDAQTEYAKNTLGIYLIANTVDANGVLDDKELKKEFKLNNQIPDEVLVSLRYSYSLERNMREYVENYVNGNPKNTGVKVVLEHLRYMTDDSFFTYNPCKRIRDLSALNKQYFHLAARVDNELHKGVFPGEECKQFADYSALILEPKSITPTHVALYLMLMSKMLILQSAVEYIISKRQGNQKWVDHFLNQLGVDTLDSNISTGIGVIEKESYVHLYPCFWQIFIYAFGGFILKQKKAEEYDLLSSITGIPVVEIDNALSVFDKLFPRNDHKPWVREIGTTGIIAVNMMPPQFAGIGANMRRHMHNNGVDHTYENLVKMLGNMTASSYLVHWNDIAHAYLWRDSNLRLVLSSGSAKITKRKEALKIYLDGKNPAYANIEDLELRQATTSTNKREIGYVATRTDGLFDLYIIKKDNKDSDLSVFNKVENNLKLKKSNLHCAFVIGTDPSTANDCKDKVWFFGRKTSADVAGFENVLAELDKI